MISLDLQTFRQSRENGNVTGVIFLALKSGAFPDEGWSDFPVIILGWWMDAWLQLQVPTRREVRWHFMDGPHGVRLTKAAGTVSTNAYELPQVHSSLIEAAERVIAHCEQHKMLSGDLVLLRDNVQRLKTDQAVHRTGAGRFALVEIRPSLADGSRR